MRRGVVVDLHAVGAAGARVTRSVIPAEVAIGESMPRLRGDRENDSP
jgi:acetyltransferase-like isoleucine patch superfamily enzyme